MDCMKSLCEMKEQLILAMQSQLMGNLENVDTHEAGEVVDMIKDLAEAEYYCTVTLAMEEAGEDSEYMGKDGRMGYNMRRSPRTGRYISSGGSGMRGYKPMVDQEPYIEEYLHNPNDMKHRMQERYGYHPMYTEDKGNDYGAAYNEFRMAKRNYTETKSPTDKKEMDSKTQEHVHNSMYTLREMWEEADPELRKKMKSELETLIKEMAV